MLIRTLWVTVSAHDAAQFATRARCLGCSVQEAMSRMVRDFNAGQWPVRREREHARPTGVDYRVAARA